MQTPAYYDQIFGDYILTPAKDGDRRIDVLPQVAALPIAPPPPIINDSGNAPIASFMRHNGGWSISFSMADPALAISWRLGESGGFRETGFLDALDPRTRRRMPNPSIELPSDAPAATIQVRYVDPMGQMQGPYPIKFDPEAALINSHRKLLDMTSTSWLAFGGYSTSLVYFSQIFSYRCAIREMRIGIDTTVPDKVVKVPPCNPKDPSSIPDSPPPYMKIPASAKSVSVELTYQDGSVSEIKNFRK
jgi:hypothetical protein